MDLRYRGLCLTYRMNSTPNRTYGDLWSKRHAIFAVRNVEYNQVYPYGTEYLYVNTPNSIYYANGVYNYQRYFYTIQENGSNAFNWWSERTYGLLLALNNLNLIIYKLIY